MEGLRTVRFILSYAVSVQKRTLVIINASLANKEPPKERFTDMTLNEMILASWIAEGQEPETLRFLGIWMIQSEAAETQMVREFSESQGGLLHTDRITLRPGAPRKSTAFTDNVFLRCGLSLARKLDRASAEQDIELKKADFLKAGVDDDDLVLYIVMQFGDQKAEEVADVMAAASELNSDSGLSDEGEDEIVFGGRNSDNGLSDEGEDEIVFGGRRK